MALGTTTGALPLACLIYSLLGVVALTTTSHAACEATTVRVSATPVFPAIQCTQRRHNLDVLVRVEAPAEMAQHAPIDLVAVLDVSESMNAAVAASCCGGPSTRLHMLKKAVRFVISKLDDSDRLAIVAFNDRVVQEKSSNGLLAMSGHGRYRAKRMVDELVAGGRTTSFRPALERAMQILDERDQKQRAGFVLLVSDGKEDSGIKWWCKEDTCMAKLLGKYPVHTFGLSASHDPRTLYSIAMASHGTYTFVNDEDTTDSLTSALAMCLGGLKTVVAADTRVVLTAAEQGGAVIKGIEVRNFVVRLHVPELCDACCGFDHHRDHKLLTVAVDGAGRTAVIQRPQAAEGAGWPPASEEVVSQIALLELVDLVAKFLRDYELDGVATAILGDRLEREWEDFTGNHRSCSGVDGLDSDIRAMASCLRRGAAAYIYSWLSSYCMQRATTMQRATPRLEFKQATR